MIGAAQLPLLPREALLYTLTPPLKTGKAGSSSSGAPSILSLIDLSNPTPHTPLLSLRTPVTTPRAHSLTRLGPSHILHADAQRSLVHLHSLSAPSLSARLLPATPLASLAASNDGEWLAASSAQDGHVWLWNAQGALVASWQAAYRAVTKLRWSIDAEFLVTAGEDARVTVWTLAGLLNPTQSNAPSPYAVFTDHALPVTDVALGQEVGLTGKMFTASLDGTIKTWHLPTRKLLHTHVLPSPVSHLALDPTGRFLFAAGAVPIGERTEAAEASSAAASAQGGRVWRVDLVGEAGLTEGAVKSEALVIPSGVTSMVLSLSVTTLLVGTATGHLRIYDVQTAQLLRTVDLAPETNAKPTSREVSNLIVLLRPADSTAAGAAGAEKAPEVPHTLTNLGRTVEKKEEIRVQLRQAEWEQSLRTYLVAPSLRPSAAFVASEATSLASTPANTAEVATLQAEVTALRSQLERAKRINEELWAATVDAQTAPAAAAGADKEANGSASKRRRAAG